MVGRRNFAIKNNKRAKTRCKKISIPGTELAAGHSPDARDASIMENSLDSLVESVTVWNCALMSRMRLQESIEVHIQYGKNTMTGIREGSGILVGVYHSHHTPVSRGTGEGMVKRQGK